MTQISGELSVEGAANLTVSGGLTVSGIDSSLSVDTNYADPGGGSLTVDGTLTNSSYVYIGGNPVAPATVTVGGLANTGTLDIGGNATLNVSGSMTDICTISGAGTLTLTGTYLKSDSTTTTISTALVNNGTVNVESGTLNLTGALSNNAVLQTTGGKIDVTTAVTGSGGTVSVSGGGTAEFDGAFNQNANFTGFGALLLSAADSGSIGGFGSGDVLDLINIAYAAGDYAVWSQGDGTLQIFASGGGSPLRNTQSVRQLYHRELHSNRRRRWWYVRPCRGDICHPTGRAGRRDFNDCNSRQFSDDRRYRYSIFKCRYPR